jgi:hypothetical protein
VIALPVALAGSPVHAEATTADLIRVLEELGARIPTHTAPLETELEHHPDLAHVVEVVTCALGATAA